MRSLINPEEKGRLASAVVSRLDEAQIIYLDEGYTEQLIAQRLPDNVRMTVVTPALPVATMLAARPNVQVILVAGFAVTRSVSWTRGRWTCCES